MLILITDVCLVSIFVDAQSLEACIFYFLSPLPCITSSPSQGVPRSEIPNILLSLFSLWPDVGLSYPEISHIQMRLGYRMEAEIAGSAKKGR